MTYYSQKAKAINVPKLNFRPARSEDTSAPARYDPLKLGLAHRFRLAYDAWRSETFNSSLFSVILSNARFREIVQMGTNVLPLIFEKLTKEQSFIYLAANEIVGETPTNVAEAEDIDSVVAAWLEWSEGAGIRDSEHG